MNDVVRAFLLDARQLPGFQEFLKEAKTLEPPFPRFKKGASTTEQFGAEALFASGRKDQHERWLSFLTGGSSQIKE